MLLRAGMLIGPNDTDASLEVLLELRGEDVDVEKIIDEDFPEDRQDPDFFSFYFFAGAYPIAALLTIAHLILHGIPILGFILSLAVSFSLLLLVSAYTSDIHVMYIVMVVVAWLCYFLDKGRRLTSY